MPPRREGQRCRYLLLFRRAAYYMTFMALRTCRYAPYCSVAVFALFSPRQQQAEHCYRPALCYAELRIRHDEYARAALRYFRHLCAIRHAAPAIIILSYDAATMPAVARDGERSTPFIIICADAAILLSPCTRAPADGAAAPYCFTPGADAAIIIILRLMPFPALIDTRRRYYDTPLFFSIRLRPIRYAAMMIVTRQNIAALIMIFYAPRRHAIFIYYADAIERCSRHALRC